MTDPPAPARQRSYVDLEARLAAVTAAPLRRRRIAQQAGYAIWEVRIPARRRIPRSRPRVRVLLNGGTHGDEPAGVEALLRFLEQRRYEAWPEIAFTLIPCLNPWGFVRGIREGPAGHDLNRAFRRASPATPEVRAIKRVLSRRRLTCSLDCHEDCDATGILRLRAAGGLGAGARCGGGRRRGWTDQPGLRGGGDRAGARRSGANGPAPPTSWRRDGGDNAAGSLAGFPNVRGGLADLAVADLLMAPPRRTGVHLRDANGTAPGATGGDAARGHRSGAAGAHAGTVTGSRRRGGNLGRGNEGTDRGRSSCGSWRGLAGSRR